MRTGVAGTNGDRGVLSACRLTDDIVSWHRLDWYTTRMQHRGSNIFIYFILLWKSYRSTQK